MSMNEAAWSCCPNGRCLHDNTSCAFADETCERGLYLHAWEWCGVVSAVPSTRMSPELPRRLRPQLSPKMCLPSLWRQQCPWSPRRLRPQLPRNLTEDMDAFETESAVAKETESMLALKAESTQASSQSMAAHRSGNVLVCLGSLCLGLRIGSQMLFLGVTSSMGTGPRTFTSFVSSPMGTSPPALIYDSEISS